MPEIGDLCLPDSVLEYVSLFMLSLSELACLASTCVRMHGLLTPILRVRFSQVGQTVLHFLQRDMQKVLKIKTQTLLSNSNSFIHVRYYPIGSTTLCMTHTKSAGFQYHLWNTSRKTYVALTSLEDPAMQTFLGASAIPSRSAYPITVRLSGPIVNQSTWAYPRGLFRVIRLCRDHGLDHG